MNSVLLAIIVLLVIILGVLGYLVLKTHALSQTPPEDKELQEIRKTVLQGFGDLRESLGSISEIGHDMKTFQRDFEKFLYAPKLRGGVGELILKDLLEQVLPRESFSLQHTFRTGSMVDAVIKSSKKIIPIDAKFPMDNYRRMVKEDLDDSERAEARKAFLRDAKGHVKSIGQKYILPEENTVDFAVMYVPAEALFYEIMATDDGTVADVAHESQVLVTSPQTFYCFLKTVLVGLEGEKIEEKARAILQSLSDIERKSSKLGDSLETLVRHIKNARDKADEVTRQYDLLSSAVSTARQLEPSDQKELKED